MVTSAQMKRLKKLIAIIFLSGLTACGTSMHASRDPNPEVYTDADDFYDSVITEINYTPDQQKLINYSRGLLGTDYSYGSENPTDGFDCSGFTQYVYAKSLNFKLPRTAREMAQTGEPVNIADLKAGDLVFFNLLGFKYSHVGIYIGNGRFFHASTNQKAIVIGNLKNEYFAKRYNGARRVLSS